MLLSLAILKTTEVKQRLEKYYIGKVLCLVCRQPGFNLQYTPYSSLSSSEVTTEYIARSKPWTLLHVSHTQTHTQKHIFAIH